MLNRAFQIDNPGGGDCGYYAIAIGLIPIMQNELGLPQDQRPVLSKYLSLIDPSEQAAMSAAIANYNISHPDHRSLRKMMLSLREILYDHLVEDLRKNFKNNSHTIMSSVLGVFYYFYNLSDDSEEESESDAAYAYDATDACHTEYYQDDAFRERMIEFVERVKEKEEKEKKPLSDRRLYKYIRSNFFPKNGEINPDDDSYVGNVLKKKIQPRHWATHEDLNDLADIIGVQLKTTGHGALNYPMQRDGRPILHLHHPNAFHWTTMLNEVYIPDDKYKIQLQNGALTKQDILTVLNKYTNSAKVKLFHSRHHVALATDIKKLCKDATKDVNDVIKELIETLPNDAKLDGHYFSAVKLLCCKAYQLPALEEKTSEILTVQSNTPKKK